MSDTTHNALLFHLSQYWLSDLYRAFCFSLKHTHTYIYTLYTCLHTIDGNLYKWISHSGESQVSIFFCPTKLCPVLYWEQNSERRTNTHNIFSRISQGSSYKLNSLGYFKKGIKVTAGACQETPKGNTHTHLLNLTHAAQEYTITITAT